MNPGRPASSSTLALALGLAPHEIEEHLAESHRFFQCSCFTLDDLDVYGVPSSRVIHALQRLAHGEITESEALKIMRKAATEFKQIDDAIEAADSAAA